MSDESDELPKGWAIAPVAEAIEDLQPGFASVGKNDELTPSLLARAFAGRFVTQNPADEPAEKLLERIKTEKP
jgi:hypothetical protein